MAKIRATYVYSETRLNLEPAYSGSTIELDLAQSANLSNPKRNIITSPKPSISEATFSANHLAKDSSIYFRRHERYPTSILWRLLDNRRLLELQSVDLTQNAGESSEALLTIQLKFESAILPYGLAFADPDEKDALVVFALTKDGELYTITLHKDVFMHHKASDALPLDWCKVFMPPALRVRVPYRIFASHAQELFISLSDGGLLKLDRKVGEDGTSWRETYFTAPGWNLSLSRTFAKWKGDGVVRFGDISLDPFTAVSLAISPDECHIITVTLNHTLRIWDKINGKITLEVDMADGSDPHAQNRSKFLISPTQRSLLQVLDVAGRDGDLYYFVTFSPKTHCFTFWGVWDADAGMDGVRPIQDEFDFSPPIDMLMETSSWTLEEFHVIPNKGWSDTKLWLRARSGPISRVFVVNFPLLASQKDLEIAWEENWRAVHSGRQTTEQLHFEMPAELQVSDQTMHLPSVADKWLEFLFYPGRFTNATLETALHVYVTGSKSDKPLVLAQRASLKQRISEVVSKKAAFSQLGLDHDKREIKTAEEWRVFYGLVQDLHKRRSTTTSFVFDMGEKLPWIVCADFVSPIRTCYDLDIFELNKDDDSSPLPTAYQRVSYEQTDLLNVANKFRSSLSPAFNDNFKQALLPELFSDPSLDVIDRITALQDAAAFSAYIGDEDWERLEDALEEVGGYDVLDAASFSSTLKQMSQNRHGRRGQEEITRYGSRAMIRISQENLILNTNILLDLILLVVYVQTEIEPDDLARGLTKEWEPESLYIELLNKLREQMVLAFLMSHMRTEQGKQKRQSLNDSPSMMRSSMSDSTPVPTYVSTLMESMFIGDWRTVNVPLDLDLPELLTYWSRRWITGLDIQDQFENFTSHVLGDLVKHQETALCATFLPYVPVTPWSTYLKGRYQLLLGQYETAAQYFQKAAYTFSSIDIKAYDTATILRPDETSLLSEGIIGYYEHVMDLFDHLKAFSHVVSFAESALLQASLAPTPAAEVKSKKSIIAPPPSHEANLLSRLFTAALDSAQFDLAYSAFTRLPNAALRKSSLHQFTDTLLRLGQSGRLVSYPFTTLAAELDADLQQKSRTTLSVGQNAPPYHRVLYARRIKGGDFRGAAQCLWEYIVRLKGMEGVDERLVEGYLMAINALSCVGEEDAWVLEELAGDKAKVRFSGEGREEKAKRRVVWLKEVRKEYQDLLDRMSEVQEGKYPFVGDGMEVDVL